MPIEQIRNNILIESVEEAAQSAVEELDQFPVVRNGNQEIEVYIESKTNELWLHVPVDTSSQVGENDIEESARAIQSIVEANTTLSRYTNCNRSIKDWRETGMIGFWWTIDTSPSAILEVPTEEDIEVLMEIFNSELERIEEEYNQIDPTEEIERKGTLMHELIAQLSNQS